MRNLLVFLFALLLLPLSSAITVVYDDFEDASIDYGKWAFTDATSGGTTTVTETNGYLELFDSNSASGIAFFNSTTNLTASADSYIINFSYILSSNGASWFYAFDKSDPSWTLYADSSGQTFWNGTITLTKNVTNPTQYFISSVTYASGPAPNIRTNSLTVTSINNVLSFQVQGRSGGSSMIRIYDVIYTVGGSETNLVSPINNFQTINGTFNLTANATSNNNFNLTNMTYFVWYNNATLLTSLSKNVNGTFNQTTQNFTFPFGDNFNWNVLTCASNGTSTDCNFALQNRTFSVRQFAVVSAGYPEYSYETQRVNFNISIQTINNILSVSSRLFYNNIPYQATTTCVSNICNASVSFDLPTISPLTAPTNNSFRWAFTVFDGSNNFGTNSTNYSHQVTPISLSVCGPTANQTLNFTAYEEQNLTRINQYDFYGTFNMWLGAGTTYRNFSFSRINVAETSLCLGDTNFTYRANADIQYNSMNGTYNARNYYLINASLNNVTNNINLYLLRSLSATSFILQVVDQNSQPVSDVYIYSQRYYAGNNTFVTVQVGKTDANGKTVGFFETETVDYKFILVKNNNVLLTTEQRKVFPESSPFTLTFRVGQALQNPFSLYQNQSNLLYSLTHNKTTGIIDYTYIDLSGTTNYGRLVVQLQNPSRGPTTICDVNSSQSSATILCNVSAYNGTIVARAYISRSPEVIVDILNIIVSGAKEIFGRAGLFLGFLIMAALALMTIFNPIVLIITQNIALIMLNTVGLFTFSPIVIFGVIIVSIIVVVMLRQ